MTDETKPYEYPFEMAPEDEIRFRDEGAIEGKPAGVPSSYEEGGSTRWTPEAISEVHALGAARPLSGARLQHLQQAACRPSTT